MIDVDVWADVRCPWCWIGSRRLQRARAVIDEPVRVRGRSLLLEPHGPASPGRTTAEVATGEWGMSVARWASTSQHLRVQQTLAGEPGERFAGEVTDDQEEARRLSVTSAPTVIVDGRRVSGTASVDELTRILAGR